MSWLYTLIVGGIIGWLANLVVHGKGKGIIWNVLLGMIGAVVGAFLFGVAEISIHSTFGFVIQGIIGSVVLILVARKLF